MGAGPVSLVEALALVGWGPRDLVAAINDRLTDPARRLDPTAAYSWIRRGYLPYEPIPSIVASVLSQQLGYPVSVEQLWPDRTHRGRPNLTAVTGLDQLHTVSDVLESIDELTAWGIAGRHRVVGAGGPDLLAVADGLRCQLRNRHRRASRERVLEAQVDLIAVHLMGLRRLDDRYGGAALSLRYVTGELRSVLELARAADYHHPLGQRLLVHAADLAQLLGWLHFDAGSHGTAERYLLLSIGICRALADSGRESNALGMLAYVSAFAGHGSTATQIASLSQRVCPDDPLQRARVMGRVATAAAAAGDLASFRQASDEASKWLAGADRDPPEYLYYLGPEQLAAETGQGLVVLAERVGPYRRKLLEEAVTLLEPVTRPGARTDYPRSALLHATFLARAHLLRNEPEPAVAAVQAALPRLAEVRSLRGIECLRRLRTLFARRRARVIVEFLPHLDDALAAV